MSFLGSGSKLDQETLDHLKGKEKIARENHAKGVAQNTAQADNFRKTFGDQIAILEARRNQRAPADRLKIEETIKHTREQLAFHLSTVAEGRKQLDAILQ